ncbi:MAG: 50S ribosomal protein L35 [Dehalococcoidia bacterium]|nr:50S ribosomal protein L35 [Dehalococcoidia bacterium]
MSKSQKGPKLKTHRATAGRIKVTGNKKFLRMHVGGNHLRNAKSKQVKRDYGKKHLVPKGVVKLLRRLLPHSL